MRYRKIARWICIATLIGAPGRSRAAEGEQSFGEWTVEAPSTTAVRASTHGTKVYGHVFAVTASANACEEPLLWITRSAQGPDKPKVEQFQKGEPVQLAIAAGGKTVRVELPLVRAKPLTSNITVFALTNVTVPKELLGELVKGETVKVTVEKPEWLAKHILDPEDSFSLRGFEAASAALTQRCSALAEGTTCPGADLAVRTWIALVEGASEPTNEYLAKLGACVAKKPRLRARVDYVAVDALQALDAVPEESRPRWTAFVAEVLRVNGNAGEASSQHNLAGMYNAQPGSQLAKAFNQDYGRFIYWTRRAASQGEPRALFNLAVRLAGDDASGGVQPDPVLAYQLFLALDPMLIRYGPQLDPFRPVVESAKQKLEKKLGDGRVRDLKNTAGTFRFASLAPAGSEPAPGAAR